MENQARSDATSEGNTTPSIVTDIVAQLAAALRDIINPGQRDSDLPRYDGTYPAANFFQQYDDIAGRAYLTETKRLQKLPAQLSVIVAVYACGVNVEKGPIRQQLWNAPPCDNVES
ncbi:hypothetical protein LAZ67_X004121 [Cordylochernes scorpioides]|uniref:Uncharacterized protein n=1 Tax=Cordylochernes scorpioides TaxID=51811 RepID=A0ABY6LUL4_9ARAC|nr:hypothetical protein LAZ67_X004121 [Cordylochernes scorpioides]